MLCAFLHSLDVLDPMYQMTPVPGVSQSRICTAATGPELSSLWSIPQPSMPGHSSVLSLPVLSPGSRPAPPMLRTPLPILPEKSVYSNVHIDSFPPRKKFTLEVSLLQLSLIAHHILSPGSALSFVRTKHVLCEWNCLLWTLPEGQSFLTC